jgi:opacity protein-like surface antigen
MDTMKKICALTVFAALPIFTVFGTDFSLSAGGGGLLSGLFTRYTLTADGMMGVPVEITSVQEVNQFNYGGYLFFDATWAEFSLGFQRGINTFREDMSGDFPGGGTMPLSSDKGTGTETMLALSLLGKYPFRLNRQFAVFPLAGLEYQIALLERRKKESLREYDRTDGIRESDSNGNAYELSAWNSLFVELGAGFDFAFLPNMFLRTELLYVFRLQTPYEVDALEKVKKMANAPNPKLGGLTSGPVLRTGIGYLF